MFHALLCTDRPGMLETRMANREAHLAYLEADPLVRQAGPLLDETGAMAGSLIVFETAERAHVEAFAAADPYARAGLFAEIRILPWNRVLMRDG
jgi:uncharacterized protein YciI